MKVTLPTTMRAAVISEFGSPEVLRIQDVPVPNPKPGHVLIRVEAFGINRSEQHFRRGLGSFGTLPRIPGLEAVGTIVALADPCVGLEIGQQVCALMGGMGREFDGGYAQYVCAPAAITIPFTSPLLWEELGAVPEMLQTANGSITIGTDSRAGDWLLIRGGTSSIGLACLALARARNIHTIATTRNPGRLDFLREAGADHALVDTGNIADHIRHITAGRGADGAVELVGTNTLRDTLASVRRGGTVCFTGMLSDQWAINDFYPMDWIPNGVRLTAYSGDAADLPASALQEYLDGLAAGTITAPRTRVWMGLEKVVDAHRLMDEGEALGKQVVRVTHEDEADLASMGQPGSTPHVQMSNHPHTQTTGQRSVQ
ncbi:zinc-binding dehydrogenase [Schaalia vaccimaxillae]|uniref:zinc-binding dehydrogenase n=1 Tax=Schaalia vaccimaxillae TaxID=183916 RepID=UPI0003B5B6F6|nr:zinc-binding dehydrogenase [Schaalia vaccimaxillae]